MKERLPKLRLKLGGIDNLRKPGDLSFLIGSRHIKLKALLSAGFILKHLFKERFERGDFFRRRQVVQAQITVLMKEIALLLRSHQLASLSKTREKREKMSPTTKP
jgi:hypothetical protein